MRHSDRLLPTFAMLALLLPAAAHGQRGSDDPGASVFGYVVDAVTGRALVAAEIELPDHAVKVQTDNAGRFAVIGLPRGGHRFVVRHLGFEDYTGEWALARDLTTVTIALGPRPISLEGITAHAYRFGEQIERRAKRAGTSVRAVGRDYLQTSTAVDAFEALRMYTGLSRATCPTGSSFDCVYARGRPVSPRVYIDDRPAFGLWELESYPPNQIYRIEMFSGGRHIRAYTLWFVENGGSTGFLTPIIF